MARPGNVAGAAVQVQSRCRAGAEQVQSRCRAGNAGAEQIKLSKQKITVLVLGGRAKWTKITHFVCIFKYAVEFTRK